MNIKRAKFYECKSEHAGVMEDCLIPNTPTAKDSWLNWGFNFDLQRQLNQRFSNLSFVLSYTRVDMSFQVKN